MKRALIAILMFFSIPIISLANTMYSITLKNGTVLTGAIESYENGELIEIKLKDGSFRYIKSENIASINEFDTTEKPIHEAVVTTPEKHGGFLVRMGFDTDGKHDISAFGLSGDTKVKSAPSMGIELFSREEQIEAGVGVEYQVPRSQKGADGNFSFIPIYATLRILALPSSRQPGIIPYCSGRIGYDHFSGANAYDGGLDTSGGLYYGFGGGVIINRKVQIDIIYSVCHGSVDLGIYKDADVDYKKLGISFGIRS